MTDATAFLDDILAAAAETHAASANERYLLGQLTALAERMAKARLQLAVVGQFKRGKSALLNALLGIDVLPTGILPVTAIGTFIQTGPAAMTVVHRDGTREEVALGEAAALAPGLARFVSEAGNPDNRLNVREVQIRLESPFLAGGVMLIDTPGVGSTLSHNTEAAEAILPEADVALFVVSPDPPVTETEIDYLKDVQSHAVRTMIVLNKCDTVTPDERRLSIGFLEKALAKAGVEHLGDIMCVSARRGLAAKLDGNETAAAASGLTDLEARLLTFLAQEKRPALARSFQRKALRLLELLSLENDLVLKALELPAEQLAGCAERLTRAMDGIARQRRHARDLLYGNRRRLVEKLRAEAEEFGARIEAKLIAELDAGIDAGDNADRLADGLLDTMPNLFETEFAGLRDRVEARVAAALGEHQTAAQALAEAIRAAAANALGIEIGTAPVEVDADFRLDPAWYKRREESPNPLPRGFFAPLLPRRFAAARARRRIRRELEQATRRNVEKLRWSLQQAIEAAFRTFERELDAQLDALGAGTGEAIGLALSRREERAAGIADEASGRRAFGARLARAIAAAKGASRGTNPAPGGVEQLKEGNDARN